MQTFCLLFYKAVFLNSTGNFLADVADLLVVSVSEVAWACGADASACENMSSGRRLKRAAGKLRIFNTFHRSFLFQFHG